MAQMGEDKAQNENVKQYAEMLERDHSTALNELRQIAQHSNVSLDNNAPAAEKASMSNRLNANGAQFDREFMSVMIEHHRKDIAEFERMQNSATGEVKAFIEKTLPVIRQHLARGEELMKGMGTN
jgi:putative membrane protein